MTLPTPTPFAAKIVAAAVTLPGVVFALAGLTSALAVGQDAERPATGPVPMQQQVAMSTKLDAIIVELAKADPKVAQSAIDAGVLTAADLAQAVAIDPSVSEAASAVTGADSPAVAAP